MSDALVKIEEYFQHFHDGVERCRKIKSKGCFSAPDWQDAYERLYRLLNRYDKEKRKLDKSEREALANAFEDDVFIRSLPIYRAVGSHMQSDVARKGGVLIIRDVSGAPVELDAQTSALGLFEADVVNPDSKGRPYEIHHLDNLEVAERRLAKAIDELRK